MMSEFQFAAQLQGSGIVHADPLSRQGHLNRSTLIMLFIMSVLFLL